MSIIEDNINSCLENIKSRISFFINKVFANDENYVINFLNWTKEVITKNTIIYQNRSNNDKEMQRRRRGRIYWIDFGKNIGSEFNDYHFAIVIYESMYTAIVVPLTSEKDDIAKWIKNENLVINIGKIDDLPEDEKRNNYALIHQMRAVSKQRLSTLKYKGQYIELKLSNEQMDQIDNALLENLIKKKSK